MGEKRKLFTSYKKKKEETAKKQVVKPTETTVTEDKPAVVKVKMGSSRRLLFSFIVAAALFAACLVLIKDMTVQEETVAVLVTSSKITENKKITDMSDGITIKEVPVSMVPADVIKDISQITGQFAVCNMGKGQILTKYFFTDKEEMATDLKEPVEVSVGVSNMEQIVGGGLREGDLVNVSVVKESLVEGERGYKTVQIVSKAYVTRTFTNTGTFVSSEDNKQTAMIVNILIEASEEDAFNAALSSGKIRISLICD